MIYGAVIGDIVGSKYEFDVGPWTRKFKLFDFESEFTDDTVMTVAAAEALMGLPEDVDEQTCKRALIDSMREYGTDYPNAGYGLRFGAWLGSENPEPYYSFGNGSAMRVSSVGWLYDDLDRTREVARWTAEISHNHPEGIKGAECTATVIWMARSGFSKDDIITAVIENFGYDLSKSVDEWIPMHKHDESCMDSLPKALRAFYEGNTFEEVIRNAVAMGGDADTIAAIAGSMAEAMYEIPAHIKAGAGCVLTIGEGKALRRTIDKLEKQYLTR